MKLTYRRKHHQAKTKESKKTLSEAKKKIEIDD